MTQLNLQPLNRLAVHRVTLTPNENHIMSPAGETLIHILIGTISVSSSAGGFPHLGERANVFDAPPTCLYLPAGTAFSIAPETRIADCIVVTALGQIDTPRPARVVRPQDVITHHIGEGHYQREVREVAGGSGPASFIYGGETINPPGKWSSWPPHSFDKHPEWAPDFEETFTVFHKPISPDIIDSEAFLRRRGWFCNGEAVDDVAVLKNGNSVVVPLGAHPVIAPVNASLLYVWFYLSKTPKTYATRADHNGYYAQE